MSSPPYWPPPPGGGYAPPLHRAGGGRGFGSAAAPAHGLTNGGYLGRTQLPGYQSAPPRVQQTPPPPYMNGGLGAGVTGAARRTPPSSFHGTPLSFGAGAGGSTHSNVTSAYNSESDAEPRGHRSPAALPAAGRHVDPAPAFRLSSGADVPFSPFYGCLGSNDAAEAVPVTRDTRQPRARRGRGSWADAAGATPWVADSQPPPRFPLPNVQVHSTSVTPAAPSISPPTPPSHVDEIDDGIELNEHRLTQRCKQIIFGKVTDGYVTYALNIPPFLRDDGDVEQPQTPRIDLKCSKRRWDTLTQDWRRALHLWDSKPADVQWIDKIDLDSLVDAANPSVPVTSERLARHLRDLESALRHLRDSVSAAFGARVFKPNPPGEPTPPNTSPLVFSDGERTPIQEMTALSDLQRTIRRKPKPTSSPPLPPPLQAGGQRFDADQSPGVGSSPPSTAASAATLPPTSPHPRAAPITRPPAMDMSGIGDGERDPHPRSSSPVGNLSDDDHADVDALRVAVTSPSKVGHGNAKLGSSLSQPMPAIAITVVPVFDNGAAGEKMAVVLPWEPSVTPAEVLRQLNLRLDTAKASFHVAVQRRSDDSTASVERAAAVVTPLGRRMAGGACILVGSPSRPFAAWRPSHESATGRASTPETPSAPPCPIHAGCHCQVLPLNTEANMAVFLSDIAKGLPHVYVVTESEELTQLASKWRSMTPTLFDEFDWQAAQEIEFRNTLTPDALAGLLDRTLTGAGAAGLDRFYDTTPSPGAGHAKGDTSFGRLDLAPTPIEHPPH